MKAGTKFHLVPSMNMVSTGTVTCWGWGGSSLDQVLAVKAPGPPSGCPAPRWKAGSSSARIPQSQHWEMEQEGSGSSLAPDSVRELASKISSGKWQRKKQGHPLSFMYLHWSSHIHAEHTHTRTHMHKLPHANIFTLFLFPLDSTTKPAVNYTEYLLQMVLRQWRKSDLASLRSR